MRWERWNPPRIIFAFALVVASIVVGATLFLLSSWEAATLLGDVPSNDEYMSAALAGLLSGFVIASGPLAIWYLRRTRGWLIGAGFLSGGPLISSMVLLARGMA
jgi:hypothetical protein